MYIVTAYLYTHRGNTRRFLKEKGVWFAPQLWLNLMESSCIKWAYVWGRSIQITFRCLLKTVASHNSFWLGIFPKRIYLWEVKCSNQVYLFYYFLSSFQVPFQWIAFLKWTTKWMWMLNNVVIQRRHLVRPVLTHQIHELLQQVPPTRND